MSLVLTTDSVAPRQRVAFWQEMVCQSFVKAHCGSVIGESFRGRISTDDLGETFLSRIDADRQRIERRRADIASDDLPRYYLCLQGAGRARVVERHAEFVVETGDMFLLDNCEPYSVEYEDSSTQIVLQVPHDALRDRFRHPDRCAGRKLSGQRGITRVTGDFLVSCAARADTLTQSQRLLTAQAALTLFSEMLLEESSGQSSGSTHQAMLMARIKQFTLAHLCDASLALEAVASAMGISARYVSKLFQQEDDSFGRFLLRERIEHCRRELANPLFQDLRISEIALRGGFNNLSHFSRVFRELVGRSPREHRQHPRA